MLAPEMVANFHTFGNSESEVLGSNPESGTGENNTATVWNKRDLSSDDDSHHSFMTSRQTNMTSPLRHNTETQFSIENNDVFGLNLPINSDVQQNATFSPPPLPDMTSQTDLLQSASAAITKDICHGCSNIIMDRYVHHISNRPYHEECLLCSECGQSLTSSCYVRDGKLLCKKDYLRVRKICSGCNTQIQDGEMVMRLMTSYDVYHVTCFKCSKCNFNLNKGDKYIVSSECNTDATVTCQKCWQGQSDVTFDDEIISIPNVTSEIEHNGNNTNDIMASEIEQIQPVISSFTNMPSNSSNTTTLSTSPDNCDVIDLIASPRSQHSSVMSPKSDDEMAELSDDDDDKEMTSLDTSSVKDDKELRNDGDNDKRPKRPRTILNAVQRRAFKAAFEMSPKPCRKIREALASETGLTVRVVQVWFQNQRAKMKKLAKRQQSREHAMAMKAREQYGYHGYDPMTSLQHPMFPPSDVMMEPGYAQFPPQHPHDVAMWDRMHVSSPSMNQVSSYPDNIGFLQQHDPINSDLRTSVSPTRFHDYNTYSQSVIGEQSVNHLYQTNQHPPVLDVQIPRPMRNEEMGTPIDGLYTMQNNYFTS